MLWSHEKMSSWISSAVNSSVDAGVFAKGLSGRDVCMLSEGEVHRRVSSQISDVSKAKEVAGSLYSQLWTLIVDAKTRKRHPNGRLVTDEEEAEKRLKIEKEQAEKIEMWKKREETLKGGF